MQTCWLSVRPMQWRARAVCRFLGAVCFSEAGFKAAHKRIYDMCSSARGEDGSKIRIDMNHLLNFDKSRWSSLSVVKLMGLFAREMPSIDTDKLFCMVHDLGYAVRPSSTSAGPCSTSCARSATGSTNVAPFWSAPWPHKR